MSVKNTFGQSAASLIQHGNLSLMGFKVTRLRGSFVSFRSNVGYHIMSVSVTTGVVFTNRRSILEMNVVVSIIV
jgi:hypothetical protein